MNALTKNAIRAMETVRNSRPLVHCITNTVAQNFTANVLLACGAHPSMSVAIEEVAEFTARADALLVNLGTMDKERSRAARWAVEIATQNEKPFILDPVFAQASVARLALARELVLARPKIVRANMDEVRAMFGEMNIERIALQYQTCIVMTGETDRIASNESNVAISNGTATMAQVTAMGCALTALMAAVAAVENEPIVAATSALLWFNIAGEVAAEIAPGPGSFVPHFLDALAAMDEATIQIRAKVS